MVNFIKFVILYALCVLAFILLRDNNIPPLANKHHHEVFQALNVLSIGICIWIAFKNQKNVQSPSLLKMLIGVVLVSFYGVVILKLLVLELVAYFIIVALILWGLKRYTSKPFSLLDIGVLAFLTIMIIDKGFLL